MILTEEQQLAIAIRALGPEKPAPASEPEPAPVIDVNAPHVHSRRRYNTGWSACKGCKAVDLAYRNERRARMRKARGWT